MLLSTDICAVERLAQLFTPESEPRTPDMDKLTIISGCLFLAADIFAIASIANPDWINTGESAGEKPDQINNWTTVCVCV